MKTIYQIIMEKEYEFINNVREERKKIFSSKDYAKICKLSHTSISNIENHRRSPRLSTICKYLYPLNIDINSIFNCREKIYYSSPEDMRNEFVKNCFNMKSALKVTEKDLLENGMSHATLYNFRNSTDCVLHSVLIMLHSLGLDLNDVFKDKEEVA